jgi:ketosteroid isomerase-like protein
MSQELVDKVSRSFDAWNRGDVDAWLESAHPEIEWISEIAQRFAGAGTVYRGPADMRRYWDEWQALWNVAIEITDNIDLGDTIVALAHIRTRGGASGIDLERPIAYVFEFEDGLARRVRSYFDQQEALRAAGLSQRQA